MGYKDPEKHREYQGQWQKKRRYRYIAKRGGKCLQCRCADRDRLEFHHRDPTQKEGHRIWSWSKARLEAELAKCDLVCKDCHKAIHKAWAMEKRIHGCANTYKNGCRCPRCREAVRQYQAAYKQGRRGHGAEVVA